MIMVKNHYDFQPVDQKVLKQIEFETGSPLSFAAGVLRFHNFSFLILGCYLMNSVGMDEANALRMKQASLLIHILNLLFIAVGDWNMPPEDMHESGWPDFLRADILAPSDASTTLRRTLNRGGTMHYSLNNYLDGSAALARTLQVRRMICFASLQIA